MSTEYARTWGWRRLCNARDDEGNAEPDNSILIISAALLGVAVLIGLILGYFLGRAASLSRANEQQKTQSKIVPVAGQAANGQQLSIINVRRAVVNEQAKSVEDASMKHRSARIELIKEQEAKADARVQKRLAERSDSNVHSTSEEHKSKTESI